MKRLLCIIFSLIFTQTALAALDPIEETVINIPGLNSEITQFAFNDINNDSIPEVLVTDGEKLVLYSISLDSVLFSDVIPGTEFEITNYQILLGDVNRDLSSDILYSRYVRTDTSVFNLPYEVEILFYDGSNNYLIDSTILINSGKITIPFGLDRIGLAEFTMLDVNNDSVKELIIGYDSVETTDWYPTISYVENNGQTICFYSFPDSILWKSNKLFNSFNKFDSNHYLANEITTVSGEGHAQGGFDFYSSRPMMVSPSGELFAELLNDLPSNYTCSDLYHSELETSYTAAVGEIIESEMNLLLVSQWSQSNACYDGGLFSHYDTSYYELILINIDSSYNIDTVWKSNFNDKHFTNYIFHPLAPGYFFAFEDNSLIQFKGEDGSEYQRNDTLPVGTKSWVYPYADEVPRLANLNDSTIQLIKFDISTGVSDQQGYNLPQNFSLSQNYPNPFNPSTEIKYSLSQKSDVQLSVYNILGQQVTMLVNEQKPAGEYNIEWDAKQFSSGIYLIKLNVGEFSKSVKAILLK